MQETVVHLVIIGVSGTSQEWLVGLKDHTTLKVSIDANRNNTIHEMAFRLADYHLNIDERFLLLRPTTFIQPYSNGPINLIFTVKVPQNIKLRDAEWVKATELGEYCNSDENTLKVISEAINNG